jgi:hypothetical protein
VTTRPTIASWKFAFFAKTSDGAIGRVRIVAEGFGAIAKSAGRCGPML